MLISDWSSDVCSSDLRFAWVSDTHLYPRDVNQRFVDKTVRAFKEVMEMDPPADFLIFGGDLAQLGDPLELELGAELLKEVSIQKLFIPGDRKSTRLNSSH